MKRSLVAVAALVSFGFNAQAAPGRALIWGGGATREAADTALKAMDATDVRSMLTFSEGFPRIVESQSVKGLKPGFHVVLLGLCGEKDDAALALSMAKSVDAKVYARGVELEGKSSCPTLKAPWKVAATAASNGLELDIVSGERTLRLLALLNDEKGEPLDFVTDETECPFECSDVSAAADATSGSVGFTVVSPGCTAPNTQENEWLVSVKKKRVTVKLKEGKVKKGACD